MTELIDVARELYALPLAEFTAARNDRVKQLRGDTGLARAVKKLPKASVSAWVVNLMSRELGAELGSLTELGATIREAQAAGADLRDLDQQRRRLVAALARRGRALAEEEGQRVSDTALEEVEATLHAAMLDGDAEAALRSGVLVEPMVAAGFGSVDVSGTVAVDGAADVAPPEVPAAGATATEEAGEPREEARDPREEAREPREETEAGEPREEAREPREETEAGRRAQRRREREARRARRDAQARVELRRAEADDAAQELSDAEKHLHELEARALQLQSEIDELERRLADRRHELDTVEDQRTDAQHGVDDARDALEDADQALAEAQAALDRLE